MSHTTTSNYVASSRLNIDGYMGGVYLGVYTWYKFILKKETNLKMRFLLSLIYILPIYNTSSIDLLTVKML